MGFGDDWIVIGLALYATTFLAGVVFLGPESGRIGKLMEEGRRAEAGARIGRLIYLARLDLVLLFLIIFDMTVKPDFFDSAFFQGVAIAAVAAALISWRYRAARARMAGGPPPPAEQPT